MEHRCEKVDKLIDKISNQIAAANRLPSKYGTDVDIYTSEIHLLVSIHDNPGLNTSQLADLMGVTKSVVSRVASKIERKGLITRYRALSNQKEIFFSLTAKGRIAYAGHQNHHKRHFHDSWTRFSDMPAEHQEMVIGFLERYAAYMHATWEATKRGELLEHPANPRNKEVSET